MPERASEPLSATPAHCPTCECARGNRRIEGVGHINPNAEFYPLVEAIDRLHGELGPMGAGRRTTTLHDERR